MSNDKAPSAPYRWDTELDPDPIEDIRRAIESSTLRVREGYRDSDRVVSSDVLLLMKSLGIDAMYDSVVLGGNMRLLTVKK